MLEAVNLPEPRPLTERERSVLDAMLSVEFAGVEDLRDQAKRVQVSGGCGCGCPTVYFSHPKDEAGIWHRVDASISDSSDGIALFTSGRWLDSMEYFWLSETPPPDWPEVDRLVVIPRS